MKKFISILLGGILAFSSAVTVSPAETEALTLAFEVTPEKIEFNALNEEVTLKPSADWQYQIGSCSIVTGEDCVTIDENFVVRPRQDGSAVINVVSTAGHTDMVYVTVATEKEPAVTTVPPTVTEISTVTSMTTTYLPGSPTVPHRVSVKVDSLPDKTKYELFEELDLSGLTVSAYTAIHNSYIAENLQNVNPADYPSVFTIDTSEFNSAVPGEYEITIHYKSSSGLLKGEIKGNTEISFIVTVDDESFPSGDTNRDQAISIADIVLLQNYFTGKQNFTDLQKRTADMNGDGVLNVFDLILLKRKVMENMQSDKVIDYNVLEKQWIHGSSRVNTMAGQAYLAKSLDEFKEIIEKYELCENGSKCSCKYHDVENCIPEKIDDEFFKDKAAVVIYSSCGSGDRLIEVDRITQKNNQLTVHSTTKESITPTPDMAYHRIVLEVDRDMLKDVNEVLYENTSLEGTSYR